MALRTVFICLLLAATDALRTSEAARTEAPADLSDGEIAYVPNESSAVTVHSSPQNMSLKGILKNETTAALQQAKRRAEKKKAYLDPVPLNTKKRHKAMLGAGGNVAEQEPPNCKSCEAIIRTDRLLEEAKQPVLLLVAFYVWGIFLLWLLCSTASEFFVPSLLYWSQYFGMRPEIAGATLVAFGNGAPDLFAAGAAAKAHDVPLALGELLGSNMLHLTITAGSVVIAGHLYSERNKTEPMSRALTFHRFRETLIAYVIALCILTSTVYDGELTVAEALCFPFIYAVYLAVLLSKGHEGESGHVMGMAAKGKHETLSLVGLHRPQGGSWLDASLWLCSLPVRAVLWVTIPQIDGHWDRSRRVACSLCPLGILGLAYLTGWLVPEIPDVHFLYSLAFIGVAIGVFIYATSGDGPDLPPFYPFIAFLGVLGGAFWLDTIAAEITALVETVGIWSDIAPIRLGFTVISWGNALGDVLSCVALARCGQVRAGFAAAIAAPLIDILLGYGTTLYIVASTGGGKFNLKGASGWPDAVTNLLLLAGGCIVAALLVQTFMLMNRVPWYCPWALFGVYGVFYALIFVIR